VHLDRLRRRLRPTASADRLRRPCLLRRNLITGVKTALTGAPRVGIRGRGLLPLPVHLQRPWHRPPPHIQKRGYEDHVSAVPGCSARTSGRAPPIFFWLRALPLVPSVLAFAAGCSAHVIRACVKALVALPRLSRCVLTQHSGGHPSSSGPGLVRTPRVLADARGAHSTRAVPIDVPSECVVTQHAQVGTLSHLSALPHSLTRGAASAPLSAE
jgi:hypothetical protein